MKMRSPRIKELEVLSFSSFSVYKTKIDETIEFFFVQFDEQLNEPMKIGKFYQSTEFHFSFSRVTLPRNALHVLSGK